MTKSFKWRWLDAARACRELSIGEVALASLLAGMGTNGIESATVYASVETIAERFGGRSRGTVGPWRRGLIEHGWLVDSGAHRRRASLYSLAIPDCHCSIRGTVRPPLNGGETAAKRRGDRTI